MGGGKGEGGRGVRLKNDSYVKRHKVRKVRGQTCCDLESADLKFAGFFSLSCRSCFLNVEGTGRVVRWLDQVGED